jgi:hypothetical protein
MSEFIDEIPRSRTDQSQFDRFASKVPNNARVALKKKKQDADIKVLLNRGCTMGSTMTGTTAARRMTV